MEDTALSLIVAASRNNVIGKGNKLPWNVPEDLKRFKDLTLGHPIIMGRKTYESIGKPLPGRTNIVLTGQGNFCPCGVTISDSLEDALALCEDADEIFVIGGAQVFRQALPFADRIYLTRINQEYEGDTFLFPIDTSIWEETEREDFPDYSFITLQRR